MFSLTRYENPTQTLSQWIDELLYGEPFEHSARNITNTVWPSVDISEHKEYYTIHADLPGLEKNDISIHVENGVLTIDGEKKNTTEREKDKYYHFERNVGAFRRSFTLPENVDAENVDARYKNGVLELTLQKKPEAKPKSVEVKVK
jgi:HSP20 family protein